MKLRHIKGLIATLMMSGVIPMSRGPRQNPKPLTPEQIKAQEKRARKAAKMGER